MLKTISLFIIFIVLLTSCHQPTSGANKSNLVSNNISLSNDLETLKEMTYSDYGKKLKEIEKENKNVYVFVNDAPINEKEISMVIFNQEFEYAKKVEAKEANTVQSLDDYYEQAIANSAVNSRDEVIEGLIKKVVIQEEADKLGLSVSYQEVKDMLLEMYNIETSDSSAKQTYLDMVTGMGITVDEYRDQYEIPAHQYVMAKANLRKHIVGEDTSKESSEKFEEYIDNLVKEAEIKYPT